jgi:hypothetical protein
MIVGWHIRQCGTKVGGPGWCCLIYLMVLYPEIIFVGQLKVIFDSLN